MMAKRSDNTRSAWMPDKLGNFEILDRLGQGGMGDIYRARQRPLNRVVALKVLSPHLCHNDEFSRRFESEAKAISLLDHQNIVSMYDYGEENGLKYFAMQFIEGEDLGKRLCGRKPLSLPTIVDYAKQICRGLRYAHQHNVIHRDIKPQNILIDRAHVCRISDFGIAKIFRQSNITMTGMAVGTPEYMSPEQAEGKELDARTDIYSLGVVIYEMLTRTPPFTGKNPVAIAYKQVHELPTPPSALRRDVPKRLELIILKALKKNRGERYTWIEEMLHDLDTVDIDEKVDRPTASFAKHKRTASKTPEGMLVEKRITDRRSGDRRRSRTAEQNIFKTAFWINTWEKQHISLILIGILTLILMFHVLVQH
ncbi:MAG: protein kinase [Chitinivibrionales bacterium]|nr:protein kinase [Chitinivibrionales bacterium]MBD3356748.1 protein kinase [Chitinivibrionales bacterium]